MKILLFVIFLPIFAFASQTPSKSFSPSDYKLGSSYNSYFQNHLSEAVLAPSRPAAETDNFKYVLITEGRDWEAGTYKDALLKNLPADLKVVILVTPGQEEKNRKYYSRFIDPSRLIIASHPDVNLGFWARDSFPYPVYLQGSQNIGLVIHKYQRPFAAGTLIAESVGAKYQPANFYFVGGNLMADESGNCFVVVSPRLYGLGDPILMRTYGCKKVTRFAHVSGIGDVDEVIKILPNKRVLTNQESYRAKLESLGYQVTMLPPLTEKRTYVNSVIIGQTAWVPVYDLPTDQEAISVYENAGYKVIRVKSEKISTVGMGSFHCITMLYPEIDLTVLLNFMGAKRFSN